MPNGRNSNPSETTASYDYLFDMIAELAELALRSGNRRIAIHLEAILEAERQDTIPRRYATR